MEWHPGISMHKIRISGGGAIAGFVGLAAMLVVFLGVPEVRWLALASIPLSLAIFAGLRYWHNRKAVDLILLGDKSSKLR